MKADGPLAIPGLREPTGLVGRDNHGREAIVRDFRVERVTWPDSKDAGEQRFTAYVERSMPEAGVEISLERLSASLETAEVVQKSLEDLNTDPPEIEFRDQLSVLLMFDGEPRIGDIHVERDLRNLVSNTPAFKGVLVTVEAGE